MNTLTRFFLVAMRLAIGWLFLVEGVEKVKSLDYAPGSWARPFSSAGYLKESAGPASSFFHWQAGGNVDEKALERLTPVKADAPRERVPAALAADWKAYVQRYAEHYGFDEAQKQRAEEVLEDNLERAGRWLSGEGLRLDERLSLNESVKDTDNTAVPTAAFRTTHTFAEDVVAYRARLGEVQRVQDQALPAFGKDVAGARLRALKAEAAKLRTDLLNELDEPLRLDLARTLTADQKGRREPGEAPAPAVLYWTDRAVAWGLAAVGGGLLLGLLTRLSCLGGAAFLVMLYAAMPSWPWLPENVRAEGHYLFVNKNLILAVGLLALATTRSGCWFGLDGLLQFLNPFGRRKAPEADAPPARRPATSTR